MFKPNMVDVQIFVRVSPFDFLDTVDKNITEEVDEIDIIFTSDVKDITMSQNMSQPRSMLCRKLERIFIEENFGDFDYNWLPKCFRHLNS